MHSEVIKEIRRMRGKGYSVNDTARMARVTPEQVRHAMRTQSFGNREPDGTELIDGEPISLRIERLKREIREGRLVIQRQSR